jgi:hypothetical protein
VGASPRIVAAVRTSWVRCRVAGLRGSIAGEEADLLDAVHGAPVLVAGDDDVAWAASEASMIRSSSGSWAMATVSVGATNEGGDGPEPDELVRIADDRLQCAVERRDGRLGEEDRPGRHCEPLLSDSCEDVTRTF